MSSKNKYLSLLFLLLSIGAEAGNRSYCGEVRETNTNIHSSNFFHQTSPIIHLDSVITADSATKKNNFKLSRIVLTGNGYFGIDVHLNNTLKDSAGLISTTMPVGIAPVLLWKMTDHLFFESEGDLMSGDGMVSAELGYINLSYRINKLMTIQAGKFLSPFGIFSERYHPFWINNSTNEPLGFSHTGYTPLSELGACLRGGTEKVNYAIYLSNNPNMENGNNNINNAGKIYFDTGLKFNDRSSEGGRIGLLPFNNSSLELGISYKRMQIKQGGSAHTHTYSPSQNTPPVTFESLTKYITGNMFAIDLNIHKVFKKLKGLIDLKSQADYLDAGPGNFTWQSEDGKEHQYSFANITQIGFIMLSYKPILAKNEFLKSSGLFVRGGTMYLPHGSRWYENTKELTAGLNYSFSWRSTFKLGYQQVWSTNKRYTDNIMIQWAVGF